MEINRKFSVNEQAIMLANNDFELEISTSEVKSTEDFLLILSRLVRHLIDNDFERLLNGLYRIDVNENRVKQALASQDNVAGQIALLIIEREVQKVKTRQKYSSGADETLN